MTKAHFIFLVVFALFLEGQAQGKWFTYNPRGAAKGNIYQDVMSRCPASGPSAISRSGIPRSDKSGWCHEATHFIDSEVSRMQLRQGYGAFYVGDGFCYIVPPPNVTVGMVAQAVPQQQRDQHYKMYLTGERVTRNCLSILDEWSCYANDSQCTKDLRLEADGGIDRAKSFSGFADVLVQVVKQRDPSYATTELVEFVTWQKTRVAKLAGIQTSQAGTDELFGAGDSQIMDLAPELRELNTDGSCVHCSTSNLFWWLGEYAKAAEYIHRYHGGENPRHHPDKLQAIGAKFAMTSDGDTSLLEWAIANRRGAGVTWSDSHVINLVGRENGQAVLMGNHPNGIRRFFRQPWADFIQEWKSRGGWAFVILDGDVPPPVPVS